MSLNLVHLFQVSKKLNCWSHDKLFLLALKKNRLREGTIKTGKKKKMECNKILSHQGMKSQDKSSESIFSFSKSPVSTGIEMLKRGSVLSRTAVPNQNYHLAKPVLTASNTNQPFSKLWVQTEKSWDQWHSKDALRSSAQIPQHKTKARDTKISSLAQPPSGIQSYMIFLHSKQQLGRLMANNHPDRDPRSWKSQGTCAGQN